ncbi:MAG: glucose dehydrogenase [Porticoccaceae bacterium]|nr:MAG: glucose dehydrogenase [Porticoccaceae bacterium]
MSRIDRLGAALFALAAHWALAGPAPAEVDQHQLGVQYSPLAQIHRGNVARLEVAWVYHTGDLPADTTGKLVAFEDEPSLVAGHLVICTVKRRLVALDPATGTERWTFDPGQRGVNLLKCRGVANWTDRAAPPGRACRTRLFLGTADYRLLAIDAATGKPCADFGDGGEVRMPVDKPLLWPGEVAATSNPAVVGDVVVVGSAVADNQRVAAPSGRVLAFDARSGALRWSFDPVPRDPSDPAYASWGKGTDGFGQGNVWSSMAVDQALDLVYLPTTSPSSDFYGGDRPGDNHYTTSVVALRGSTGEVVWHRQLVHHNVFDYDLPARPILVDYPVGDRTVPALVQLTKMGMIFVFDRRTGEPLVSIEERPVPQEGALPGEVLSPTQPFPVGMPLVTPHGFGPEKAWGFTFLDRWLCRREIERYRYGPIYTPPSEQGTIFMPAMGGGPNWGGGAWDPQRHLLVVPSNRVPAVVRMVRRGSEAARATAKIEMGGTMVFDPPDSPWIIEVRPLLSPLGAPCSPPPWAALTAVDLAKKRIVWEKPLGSIKKLAPLPIDWHLGTPGAGGPLATAGGLVFIGYTLDDSFRAFDVETGEILWEADLPAAGVGVPVSYEAGGRQYVVIAAGGHSMYGSTLGDAVVAFALPEGERAH